VYIIIDSSQQLVYTGILTGHYSNLDALYDDFEKLFSDNNVAYKYHWSKLSRKIRNNMKNDLVKLFRKSSKINFNILHHRKPNNISRKDWFLHHLPARIAQRLERWLESKGGSVELIVDNDYNVSKGGRGTNHFIESLIRQLSWRLTNKEVTIRNEEKIKATIKQSNGNTLNIYASVAPKNSKWVGMTDVYLGLYVSDKKLFNGLKNVYLHKIK
jgi:hypothetical protein